MILDLPQIFQYTRFKKNAEVYVLSDQQQKKRKCNREIKAYAFFKCITV